MKLGLATGILSGSFPVVAASAADTTLQAAQNLLLPNTNGAIQGISLYSIQDCDPTSKDPDVGVLSCGEGRLCLPKEDTVFGGICESEENLLNLAAKFRKRGALKNLRKGLRKSFMGSVECDPMANADVGILSCGRGETCVSSTFSSKGGLCVPSTEGRRLQDLTEPLGICDPTSQYYLAYDCDCRGLDNVTGSGEVVCIGYDNVCLGDIYTGCDGVCVSTNFSYTYVNNSVPSYTFCAQAITPYSQVVCFDQDLADNTCTINFNDDPCTSCEVIPTATYTGISFDCTNSGGTIGVSYYTVDLLPAVQTCSSQSNSTTSACDICGGPLVNPDAVATVLDFSFTCSEFTTLLNSSTCSLASPLLAPTCCTASASDSTPAPPASPTSASIEPSPAPGDEATPAPESGGENLPSSGRSTVAFATSPWFVTLGLVIVWTFGQTH